MADRPILFSGPMVRALLEGRKTQTRRLIKPQPPEGLEPVGRVLCSTHKPDEGKWTWARGQSHMLRDPHRVRCLYGQPGDLLWVRETWGFNPDFPAILGRSCFKADPGHEYDGIQWKPSIHMPRRLSRLTLRITDVRVERVNDITGLDAIAEGLVDLGVDGARWHWERNPTMGYFAPWRAYRALWDSINGPGSWSANPWVWALTFEVVPRNIDSVLLELANAPEPDRT